MGPSLETSMAVCACMSRIYSQTLFLCRGVIIFSVSAFFMQGSYTESDNASA